MIHLTFEDLPEDERKLLNLAEKAMGQSYSPYSGFCAGVALQPINHPPIIGANIENASYGISICAEQAAFCHANALGIRTFSKLAMIARENPGTQRIYTPCGACRQVISEFAQVSEKDIKLIISDSAKERIRIVTINEILPGAFGPTNLGVDLSKYR